MALTTDSTPRIYLTAAQVLQDPQKTKRLKSALAAGAFSNGVDEAGATLIIDECLKICGGSAETLSDLLGTTFIADHTPFYWIIVNRHPSSSGAAPTLLPRLLEICKERDLSIDAQRDILEALYVEYDSDLYCAIQTYIPAVPVHKMCKEPPLSTTREDCPRVTTTSSGDLGGSWSATIEFAIPRFFSRLLVDGEVYFEFLIMGRAWGLRALLCAGRPGLAKEYLQCWEFEVSEIWVDTLNNEKPGSWKLNGAMIVDPQGITPSQTVNCAYNGSSPVTQMPTTIHITHDILRTLRRNPYTSSPDGRLCGKIFAYGRVA